MKIYQECPLLSRLRKLKVEKVLDRLIDTVMENVDYEVSGMPETANPDIQILIRDIEKLKKDLRSILRDFALNVLVLNVDEV